MPLEQSALVSNNPYISEGSNSDWPADLPMPRVLFPRTRQLPPNEHLELVCSVERTGVVGDVIFDLRHPELDPTRWSAESLLRSEEDRRRYQGRLFLWFPWYGEYRLELTKSMVHHATKSQSLSGAKKNALEKESSPEQILYHGDRISLQQVGPRALTGLKMRDMVQGESTRLALLEITRPDGPLARSKLHFDFSHDAQIRDPKPLFDFAQRQRAAV